jgi:beta-lactamase class A
MKMLARLVLAGLVMIAAGMFATSRFDAGQKAVLSNTVQAAVQQKAAYTLDEQSLADAIQSVVTANPQMDLSVSIVDLQTKKTYHYGDMESYTAASITKLMTIALFLQETETGKTSLTQEVAGVSARTLLERLIVDSDNEAWHVLNDALTHDALKIYASSIGIESYDPDANIIRTDDVALLLGKLAGGQLLNNANTDLLLSFMSRAGMRNYLVAGVPAGASAYHKTGYLSDRFHDAAIVKKGDRSFVLVAFSKTSGSYDFSKGATVFQGLASSVSSVFFGAPE